ncbi:cation-translocating P-type ATPase [Limnoraphis robusta]|uniref:cation-translocating P-type ATPase n=1 Tax=Limnoraphis robusta TaxID=1118279 RepID=UPI002B20FD0D|nr:cation-transporting P-type ATPase [Limnoraphis robusta]MEA5500650.1 cation-transporting P-type ATPase [Limnoraphis robusta BA-68 BA1]
MTETKEQQEQFDLRWTSSHSTEENLNKLSVETNQGLASSTVKKRQEKYGPNRLQEIKRRSNWQIFIEQFKSPIVGLLAIAAVLSFSFQDWVEGIAIIIAIFLNAVIGFFTELKAVNSMESLQELSHTKAKVRRDQKVQEISAEELVPGDIVVLESGDLVPADVRILEASKLQADESALTGESLPVSKTTEALEGDLSLAERTNMLFKGTAITLGSGEGVVIATGMNTELGHISSMTAQAKQESTPLEQRLDKLGQHLIWVTLVIVALVAGAGIIGGKELFLMIQTAIALAVAAVPEGLPIVATVALARGMWRMAKRNALINRLSAVETLGATNIICTDKTGTLTENRMSVAQIALSSGILKVSGEALKIEGEFTQDEEKIDPQQNECLRSLLEVGVLCNKATLPELNEEKDKPLGDPMEVALLVAGAKGDIRRKKLLETYPEVQEIAFDSDSKMMATIHDDEEGYRFAIKGAPESVIDVCTQQLTAEGVQDLSEDERNAWQERCNKLAKEGLRILAFASKNTDNSEAEPYENLTLLGVVGLLDPPREQVKSSLKACHDAGIRVIMVTGDQAVTARNIALAVGLITEQEAEARQGNELQSLDNLSKQQKQELQQVSIFARVSPEQKLNLVTLHQEHNAIVAMTGDGVNDAPALKKADIGIAMGKRGTQVAQEAADMVLQDDAFSTIVAAVEQGRAIFGNIRKFTLYLLSGNMGEIIAVAGASLVQAPLPLLPLQILFLNAINDVFPALALGVGEGSPNLMKQKPRDRSEPILPRRHWMAIVLYGVIISLTVLGVFWLCLTRLGMEEEQAVTISFLTLAFGRLWHVFNMRDSNSGLLRNEVTQNRYVWLALLVCTGLLSMAVYISPLANVLQLVNPGWQGWGFILAGSLIPLVIGQILKAIIPQRWFAL